jgi:hypothetical protein
VACKGWAFAGHRFHHPCLFVLPQLSQPMCLGMGYQLRCRLLFATQTLSELTSRGRWMSTGSHAFRSSRFSGSGSSSGPPVADRQDLGFLPLATQDAPHRSIAVNATAEERLTDQALFLEAHLFQYPLRGQIARVCLGLDAHDVLSPTTTWRRPCVPMAGRWF